MSPSRYISLVIGSRRWGVVARVLLADSVGEALLHGAGCSVLGVAAGCRSMHEARTQAAGRNASAT